MNRMTTEERTRILGCLVESMSIRATCRLTGAAKGTVLKFVADLGRVCARFHDERVRGVSVKRIEADEFWGFCYAKAKTKKRSAHLKARKDVGDVWVWTGMDADTKLMVSWQVGKKDPISALDFTHDLAGRVKGRIQLTTDGNRNYYIAVPDAFGTNIDYAQLTKIYGDPTPDGRIGTAQLECVGVEKERVIGNPDMRAVSTSFIERQNLTVRMCSRRFTRFTNAFSKKLENLCHSLAIHYVYYNFVRVHQSLRVTPAMAAGLTNELWDLDAMVRLLDDEERAVVGTDANRRGPYRKAAQDSD
jgi:IS1 family transposase